MLIRLGVSVLKGGIGTLITPNLRKPGVPELHQQKSPQMSPTILINKKIKWRPNQGELTANFKLADSLLS